MKVEKSYKSVEVPVSSVPVGDVFEYAGIAYIRIANTRFLRDEYLHKTLAVALGSAYIAQFEKEQKVNPIPQAKVVL